MVLDLHREAMRDSYNSKFNKEIKLVQKQQKNQIKQQKRDEKMRKRKDRYLRKHITPENSAEKKDVYRGEHEM